MAQTEITHADDGDVDAVICAEHSARIGAQQERCGTERGGAADELPP